MGSSRRSRSPSSEEGTHHHSSHRTSDGSNSRRHRRHHSSRLHSPKDGRSSTKYSTSSRKLDRDRRRSRSPVERRHKNPQRHSRSHSRSRSHRKRSGRHRSVSSESATTSYSSSSESDSSRERHRKRRRKEERKEAKAGKKHKKSKTKSKKNKHSIGDDWGKYGIIHESDIFTKEPEFQAWLIEVKNADVETLSNNKRKELFNDFMEDYNTATMPHEKYYDLEKWERRQEAIRMGEKPAPGNGAFFDFNNDEERLRAQHRQAARASAASRKPVMQLSEDKIKELARVNRERIEADRMRKMGLKPKDSMGVLYEDSL